MSPKMPSSVDRHDGRNPVATLHMVQLVPVANVYGAVFDGSLFDSFIIPTTSRQLTAPPVPLAAIQLAKFDGVVSSDNRLSVQSV